jgi:uncharacterized membrane protein YdbT with pleckstrin-like domain
MKQLDPRAIWLFFINYAIVAVVIGGSLSFGFVPMLIALKFNAYLAVLVCCIFFLAFLGFAYFWATLTYNNFKYELGEDAFKKEEGVIFKKYVSIPYDRIQNVDIYRGLISRFMGLSDLQIQTAGFSFTSQYGASTEGRLPALDKIIAEELRDELVKRAKTKKHV